MKKVIMLMCIASISVFANNECEMNKEKLHNSNEKIKEMQSVIGARYKKLDVSDVTFNMCNIKNTDMSILREQTRQMGLQINNTYNFAVADYKKCGDGEELAILTKYKDVDFPIINAKVEDLLKYLSEIKKDCQ